MSFICWVCVKEFKTSERLLQHELKESHQLLLLEQALAKIKPKTNKTHTKLKRRRRELAGFCLEVEKTNQDRYPEISFCLCSLSWIIGQCEQCTRVVLEEDTIKKKIWFLTQEKQKYETLRAERNATLLKGLQNAGNSKKYNVKVRATKYRVVYRPRIDLWPFFAQMHFALFGVQEETRIGRSPLTTSFIRQKHISRTLPERLNKVVPADLVGSVSAKVESKTAYFRKTYIKDDEVRRQLSPLVSSKVRQEQINKLALKNPKYTKINQKMQYVSSLFE